jgi:hypothetical protein
MFDSCCLTSDRVLNIVICSLCIIQAVKTSNHSFQLLFKEMACSTDYQLAKMKVNLPLLEQCVYALSKTVSAQQKICLLHTVGAVRNLQRSDDRMQIRQNQTSIRKDHQFS